MFCVKFTILFVLTLNCVGSSLGTDEIIFKDNDEDPNESEKCLTKNKEEGNCIEFLKCRYADQLYRSKQSSEITRCKNVGRVPFVCCPSLVSRSNLPPEKHKTSAKFQKALCKNNQIKPKFENHIIDGEKAVVGEFPFQVALGYYHKKSNEKSDISFDCGGSLIADDIVLTAAHCAINAQPIIVRMGRTSLDLKDEDDESQYQDIKIENIKIHPKYSYKTKHNDIAIIKLKNPYNSSDTIETICLSTSDKDAPKDFIITGFGMTSLDYKNKSDWLMKGKITEYPHERCVSENQQKGVSIVDSQLCALNEKGVDTCKGDSGGPVSYLKNDVYYLYGITSYGSGCGSPKIPSFYTKVNRFLDWIEEIMSSFE